MARQIFVSYSKKDAPFAFKLAAELEAAGYRIWIDREIGGGQQWRRTIEQNLKDSSGMIVVVTNNSVQSRWVQHESSVAIGLDKFVVPLLIEDISPMDRFVWMDEIQFIDFTKLSYEDGFEELLKSLSPPNPVQDLLDEQMHAHRETGDLIGAAMLEVIEGERGKLAVTPEAEDLIATSAKQVRFQRLLLRGVAGLVTLLVLLAIASVGFMVRTGQQVTNSLATNQAAVMIMTDSQGRLDNLNDRATLAVQEATAQASTSQAEFDAVATEQAIASTQVAEADAQVLEAQGKLVEADRKLIEAENLLKKFFDESNLVLVDRGPRALLWDGVYIWVANEEDNTVSVIDPTNGKTLSAYSVGKRPVALAYDGEAVWVASQGGNTVARLLSTEETATEIEVAEGPSALYWDGQYLWVACKDADLVQKIDPQRGEVVASLQVDDSPLALAFDGANLWVANEEANSIQRIDVEANQVTGKFLVAPGPAALLWDGTSLWIANRVADAVQRFDPIAGRVLNTITVGVADGPVALAFDGGSLWVANRGNDSIQMIHPGQKAVMATYQVGDFPRSLLWDGSNLWVGNYDDNSLQKIERVKTVVQAKVAVADKPRTLIEAEGALWLISEGEHSIEKISLGVRTDVVESIQLPGNPIELAYDGARLWVLDAANQQLIQVAEKKGAKLQFIELDKDAGEDYPTVAVGADPRAILWANDSLWVASRADNLVQQIDPVGLTVVQEFKVSGGPRSLVFDGEMLWVGLLNDRAVQQVDPLTGELGTRIELDEGIPTGIVLDGDALWVALPNQNAVHRYDRISGDLVAAVAVAEWPVSLLVENGSVWVVNQLAENIQQIDTVTNQVIATIPVEDGPVMMISIGNDFWMVAGAANLVELIDGDILSLLAQSRKNNP